MHAYYALGTAIPRASIARATILITKINPSSTSPAAHACRFQSSYGATAYLKIISGSDAVGWFQPTASLPEMIFRYAVAPYEDWNRQAWAAGLVLLGLILVINIVARAILARGIAVPRA